MLLKQPEDSNLNLPVWDPRVSMTPVLYFHISKCCYAPIYHVYCYINTGNTIWAVLICRVVKRLYGILKLAQQMAYRYIIVS